MIDEVDEGIRRLLAEGGVPGDQGELAFDAPTTGWASRRNAPTVSVFLYDIREDLSRRKTGAVEVFGEDGVLRGRRGVARWFQLSYLVTAWTNRPQDEHRLLSQALSCLVGSERLEPRWLTGTLAELGLSIGLRVAGPMSESGAATDVWSALGGELKPALQLTIIAPLAGEWTPAGPPVTEGMVLRSTTDESRRLRYEGRQTAEGEGFAMARPRPRPGARRRRGEPIR
ncbi:Pvc16 family protein [Actinophytocola sediminis]